jgi:hypothetical protein
MNVILLRDEQLRARLLELDGEAPDGFYEDLWDGIEVHGRTVARRRTLAATLVLAAAVAALTSAAVHALTHEGRQVFAGPTTVQRSYHCTIAAANGVPVLTVDAAPLAGYASPKPVPAHVIVNVGAPIGVTLPPPIVDWTGGYRIPPFDTGRQCTPAPAVAYSPRGLTLEGVYPHTRTGGNGVYAPSLQVRCLYAAHVLVSARIQLDKRGRAVSAKLAIRSARGKKPPIAYVEWSPALVRAYTDRSSCFDS